MKLAEHLFATATGRRHGISLPPIVVPPTPADVPGLINVAVPAIVDLEVSPASGGIARDVRSASIAAVGESLERYAGSLAPLVLKSSTELATTSDAVLGWDDFTLFSDAQRQSHGFPHGDLLGVAPVYTDAYDLVSNETFWVPASLMSLDRRLESIATSSGLAAHPDIHFALLRGLQEIIERDALMTTWLHEVAGRRVAIGSEYTEAIDDRRGTVIAIDATPVYSSHPVAIVMGNVPRRGRSRCSLGAACRSTWAQALDKAYIEWAQGITFIGDRLLRDPDLRFASTDDVRDFEHHAMYYSTEPTLWAGLPILQGSSTSAPADSPSARSALAEQVHSLAIELRDSGIRTLYRDLTTIDLQQIGVKAVRVMSPDLVPVHHDHRFPHLGGTTPDISRRYPWWTGTGHFPTSYPHPLG